MGYLIHSIIFPLASLVIITLGNGFFLTFVSLWLEMNGYESRSIGIVCSLFFAGQIFGVQMEKIMQRLGLIRLFITCASILSICVSLHTLCNSILWWGFLRFVSGLCITGVYIVIESWLLMLSNASNRGKILSIYMTFLYLANSASQWIKHFINLSTASPFIVTSILCSLSVLPLSVAKVYSPTLTVSHKIKFLDIVKKSPLGVFTCLISGVILGACYTFLPIFANELEKVHPDLTVQLIMSANIFGGLALQYVIGYFSDIFDRRKVLLISLFITTIVSMILLQSFKFHFWVILILMIIYGGLIFTIYPLGISQVSDHVSIKDFPKTISILVIVFGLGTVVGPISVPLFVKICGGSPVALFLHVTFFSLILFCFGIFNMKRRPMVSLEDQQDFVAMPNPSPIIPEIDPRTDF